MMKLRIVMLAALASVATAPAIASDEQASVNYDCALFDECGATAANETVPAATANPAVRSSGNVRGGFTMKREPAEAVGKAAPTIAPKARPTAKKAQIATPKTTQPSGRMQSESIRAAQQITFVSGSAELQPSSKNVARLLATSMQRPDKANVRFRIEGHTDAVGSRELNMDLSKRRAQAVANYLASLGIDSKRLDVVGQGFDQPLPGVSKFSSANRRVVAKVAN